MDSSSQSRRIYHYDCILTQTFELRKTRIAALRRDIESGQYCVKAEHVAEKIMKNELLDLLDFIKIYGISYLTTNH
jgi:anti-sigma28 factor (negative regulator of flagellin synthesis)